MAANLRFRKYYLIFCTGFSFLINHAVCQNLVPNPDFEYIIQCPNDDGYIKYAYPWYNPIKDYLNISNSYLFNYCEPQYHPYSVPWNIWGYQYPRSGKGYAAIGVYGGCIYKDSLPRSYITAKLNFPLEKGNYYSVHFYTVLAEMSTYAVNRLGVYISNDSVYGHVLRPLPYIPQIAMDTSRIFRDTMNWTPVSGIYQAKGGEKYITIGNFYTDTFLTIEYVGYNPNTFGSYHYIDDVSVYEIKDPLYKADAGEDKTVCIRDSVHIGSPPHPGYRYKWRPSKGLSCDTVAQPMVISPYTATYYLTQCDYTDLETYDTVKVNIYNCDTMDTDYGLEIYPNPACDMANISFRGVVPENVHFTINNILGQELVKDQINPEEKQKVIDTGMLPDGVYFFRVYSKSNLLKCVKVVKIISGY